MKQPVRIGRWAVGCIVYPPEISKNLRMFVATDTKSSTVAMFAVGGRARFMPYGKLHLGVSTSLITKTGTRHRTWHAPLIRHTPKKWREYQQKNKEN